MSAQNSSQRKAAQALAAFCLSAGVVVIGLIVNGGPMHPGLLGLLLTAVLGLFWLALRFASERHYKTERRVIFACVCVGAVVLFSQRSAVADVWLFDARGVNTKGERDGDTAAQFTVVLEFQNRGHLDTDVDVRVALAPFALEGGDAAIAHALRLARQPSSGLMGGRTALGIVPAGHSRYFEMNNTLVASVFTGGTTAYLVTGAAYFPDWRGSNEKEFCVVLRADGTRATSINCSTLPPSMD